MVGEVPGSLRIISADHSDGHNFCLDNDFSLDSGAVSVIWDCQTRNPAQLWRQA